MIQSLGKWSRVSEIMGPGLKTAQVLLLASRTLKIVGTLKSKGSSGQLLTRLHEVPEMDENAIGPGLTRAAAYQASLKAKLAARPESTVSWCRL